jgi:TM2 domain-containing membrane protein YozV
VVQAVIPFKNGGVAFILAFFFGLFLFNGVGHMYIGKVRRGVGIMLLGWFIYSVILLFMVFTVGLNIAQLSVANETMLGFDNNSMVPSNDITLEYLSPVLPFLFVFALVYLTFWILQAADANRLAKKFNRQLEKEGTLLWN